MLISLTLDHFFKLQSLRLLSFTLLSGVHLLLDSITLLLGNLSFLLPLFHLVNDDSVLLRLLFCIINDLVALLHILVHRLNLLFLLSDRLLQLDASSSHLNGFLTKLCLLLCQLHLFFS